MSRRAAPENGQALTEYVLLFSGVVILCVLLVIAISQAIPWSPIVDGFQSLR